MHGTFCPEKEKDMKFVKTLAARAFALGAGVCVGLETDSVLLAAATVCALACISLSLEFNKSD